MKPTFTSSEWLLQGVISKLGRRGSAKCGVMPRNWERFKASNERKKTTRGISFFFFLFGKNPAVLIVPYTRRGQDGWDWRKCWKYYLCAEKDVRPTIYVSTMTKGVRILFTIYSDLSGNDQYPVSPWRRHLKNLVISVLYQIFMLWWLLRCSRFVFFNLNVLDCWTMSCFLSVFSHFSNSETGCSRLLPLLELFEVLKQ